MRYTIMTPTLQRKSLIRACESINSQTCTDWEHLVIYDGDVFNNDLLSAIEHPNRRIIQCTAPNKTRHIVGNACRHCVYEQAKGDYLFNLDDDDYLAHDQALEDLKEVTGLWAIFPITRMGEKFFYDPPRPSFVTSENFLVKREIGRWPDTCEYAADAILVESLKAKYPYQSFPNMRPVAKVDIQQLGVLAQHDKSYSDNNNQFPNRGDEEVCKERGMDAGSGGRSEDSNKLEPTRSSVPKSIRPRFVR